MRVLIAIFALSLAYVCALPTEVVDSDEITMLLQDAQTTVSNMKAKGAKESECKDLAETMCKETRNQHDANQATLNGLHKGGQCTSLGQSAVSTAQAELSARKAELADATTAVNAAASTEVVFNKQVFSTVNAEQCDSMYTTMSNYQSIKTTHDTKVSEKEVATGAKATAETALKNAQDAAAKMKNDCLCQAKATRDETWAVLGAPALRTQQETADKKCKMMKCVLEGTAASDDSCKSDLPALTKPTLNDDAEHASGCSSTSYYTMAKGEAACPNGENIKTEAACKSAIQSLGLCANSQWKGSNPNIPGYCSHRPGHCNVHDWHWNSHTSGNAGRSDVAPICKRPETAGPCEPAQVEGQKFYAWEAPGKHCYRIVVGGTLEQDYTSKSAAKCNESGFRKTVTIGRGQGISEYYPNGDSQHCPGGKKRSVRLKINKDPNVPTHSAAVTEPSTCEYHITITGPHCKTTAAPISMLMTQLAL